MGLLSISRSSNYTLGSYRIGVTGAVTVFEEPPAVVCSQLDLDPNPVVLRIGTLQYRESPGSAEPCDLIPEDFRWEKPFGTYFCRYKNPTLDCTYLEQNPESGIWHEIDCSYFGAHTIFQVGNIVYTQTFMKSNELPISESFLEHRDITPVTQIFFEHVGGLEKYRLFEVFEFLVEIIPIPFSIRNDPDTNIWIRLRDPSAPLNIDTFVMYVNGENISQSPSLSKIRVANGMEILYNPPEDFEYESIVYVEFFVTTSNSWTTSFKAAPPAGTEFITINVDARTMNTGALLVLGPNILGQSENVEIVDVIDEDQLWVTELIYEYEIGDTITYFELGSTALSYKYWFEIIPDYRPPWFENLYPAREQNGLSVLTPISFDIKDIGTGININSLVFKINDLDITPTKIYKYNDNHYKVYYQPTKEFYYNSFVYVFIRVNDLAAQHNYAIEYWRFKTEAADTPMLTGFMPECCDNPVPTMTDVMFEIYGKYSGVNLDSLIVTIDGVNYPLEFWPKIYRSE